MKSIAVMGASGRMGQEVIKLLKSHSQLNFVAGVARSSPDFFADPPSLPQTSIDAVIDFSLPEGFSEIVRWCVENQVPLVSGTTGIGDQEIRFAQQAGEKIPILWSPNMSLGVAFVKRLLESYSSISHFDFAIDEVHHGQKKDAPSGTALVLQKQLEKSTGKPVSSMNAVRGGGVFGMHKVWALSPDEVITLEHSALNRTVFASGAIRAIEWLIHQPPGYYSLSDVLGSE